MSGTTVHINSKTYTNVKRVFIGNDAFEYKGSLPEGYSIINGLYSRLGGYINTNFPIQAGDKVRVGFVQGTDTDNCVWFGARYAGSYNSDPASQIYINKGKWGTTERSNIVIVGKPATREVFGPYDPCYLEGVENEIMFDIGNGVYLNGNPLDVPYDYTFAESGMSYAPYLFNINNQNNNVSTTYNFASGRLLGYSVERSGEVVVDMIPVKNSDGVCGMYDLARDTFFGTANGRAFSDV